MPLAPLPSRRPAWVPTPPPARPTATNEARIDGRNLRYALNDRAGVDVPWLQATLVDRTPADPLDIWAVGSYRVDVAAGRLDVSEAQLNAALPAGTRVALLDGNRVAASTRTKLGPVTVPVSIRAKVDATSPTTFRIDPESISAFGVPVGWALRILKIDLVALAGLPPEVPARMLPDGAIGVDLQKTDLFTGRVTRFGIAQGRAAVVFGEPPDPRRAAGRPAEPNYADLTTRGDVLLDAGVVRDGRVRIVDRTPQDPYTVNRWDQEGFARLVSGQVVLPQDKLVQRFAAAGGDGFYLDQATLDGTDLVVKGEKELLGLPVAVAFRIRFGATAAGELLLTPHDVRIAGIPTGPAPILAAMKGMPGMAPRGDGMVLDMRAAASLEMPPIRRVSAEPGKIVLTP